jgi:hypothetical protein
LRFRNRQDRSRLLLVAVFGACAVLGACASPTGGPAELIGTWRLSGASAPFPEACSTATLTFRRDGTFEGNSGALKTRGRYSTIQHKDGYQLKLDQLEYSGTENCQGVTARDMRARTVDVLDLAFEREGHDFRLYAPVVRGAYILYTRAN